MTRRQFICATAVPAMAASLPPKPLIVPLRRVMDSRARFAPQQLRHFWGTIWPEAAREFGRCGIRFQTTDTTGEIKRTAADRPIFVGVERGALNLVLTDHIPMLWDTGRALSGVTTIYDGYHVSVIALSYAHGNQIPFLSVNTCVHEILHALLQDIFVRHPKWWQTNQSESRVDWDASCLWLFHQGEAIRKSAEAYVAKLRSPG
jgi:hypothetical protein